MRRRHELADGVEHDLELAVVSRFQSVESPRELPVVPDQVAQAHEGTHDSTLTRTACLLRRTEESMATPCSVNA